MFLEGFLNNDENDDNETIQRNFVSCQIDMKKFLTLLAGLQITNHKTICSIVDEKMVKLHFEQPGAITLQCFLTHVSS